MNPESGRGRRHYTYFFFASHLAHREGALQVHAGITDRVGMDDYSLDIDQVTIPRWTIKRDPRALGCSTCGSPIVKVTAEWRQVSFCACRLIEYRVLPKARKA